MRLDDDTLTKYGFGDDGFWRIVCPALQDEGVLVSYQHSIMVHDDVLPPSTFTVNEDKLLGSKSNNKSVTFDWSRTIAFKEKRHVFHSGSKHPINFFKLLWDNRREAKGNKLARRGEPRPASYYAVQLGIITYASAYEQNKQAKTKVSDLIKGLNKAFRAKKIPAKVSSSGGVLLEIKNP